MRINEASLGWEDHRRSLSVHIGSGIPLTLTSHTLHFLKPNILRSCPCQIRSCQLRSKDDLDNAINVLDVSLPQRFTYLLSHHGALFQHSITLWQSKAGRWASRLMHLCLIEKLPCRHIRIISDFPYSSGHSNDDGIERTLPYDLCAMLGDWRLKTPTVYGTHMYHVLSMGWNSQRWASLNIWYSLLNMLEF